LVKTSKVKSLAKISKYDKMIISKGDLIMYVVEWKYKREKEGDIIISNIIKKKKKDCDFDFEVRQCGVRDGFAHMHFKTLRKAINNSILPINEIKYYGHISKRAIKRIKRTNKETA
jgi:hypothetical protein